MHPVAPKGGTRIDSRRGSSCPSNSSETINQLFNQSRSASSQRPTYSPSSTPQRLETRQVCTGTAVTKSSIHEWPAAVEKTIFSKSSNATERKRVPTSSPSPTSSVVPWIVHLVPVLCSWFRGMYLFHSVFYGASQGATPINDAMHGAILSWVGSGLSRLGAEEWGLSATDSLIRPLNLVPTASFPHCGSWSTRAWFLVLLSARRRINAGIMYSVRVKHISVIKISRSGSVWLE